jgi:hypothetical protein
MRQQVQLTVLIGLVIVLAVVGYRMLFGDAGALELMVVSARGAAVSGDGSGESVALTTGDLIGVDDVINTDHAGAAALQYGNGAQLMLAQSTRMKVLEANSVGVRIELDRGEVTARVRAGAPPLKISNRGHTIGATDADFTVMVSREGGLSAASQRGDLRLSGFDGIQEVGAGSAIHTDRQRGAVLRAISESLLLDVEWPIDEPTRSPEVEVSGVTGPYATVTVGEGPDAVRVRADRDGRFRATIGIAEGKNEVMLKVRDITGREAIQVQTVRRDSTAPVIEAAEVVWGP